MWDLIVSVPDHCLSFYFTLKIKLCFVLLVKILNCTFGHIQLENSVIFWLLVSLSSSNFYHQSRC